MPTESDRVLSSGDTTPIDFELPDNAARHYGPNPVRTTSTFGAASHCGLVRSHNEDHYGVVRRSRTRQILLTNLQPGELVPTEEEAFVMAVADGMGGEVFGELASRLVLTSAFELAPRENAWLMNADEAVLVEMRAKLEVFIRLIHDAFQEQARQRPEVAGMGTTLTAAYVVGDRVFVLHVGDSRAYLVRGTAIKRLTRDHTLAAEMIAAGVEPGEVSHLRHYLTRFISAEHDAGSLDLGEALLKSGDQLVLCSDGLSDLVSDAEIAAMVAAAPEPQIACEELVNQALARGGRDNVTVVIGRFEFA